MCISYNIISRFTNVFCFQTFDLSASLGERWGWNGVGWCRSLHLEKSGVSSSLATRFAVEPAVSGKESKADGFGKHVLESKSCVLSYRLFFWFSHGVCIKHLGDLHWFLYFLLLLIFVKFHLPRIPPRASGWIMDLFSGKTLTFSCSNLKKKPYNFARGVSPQGVRREIGSNIFSF